MAEKGKWNWASGDPNSGLVGFWEQKDNEMAGVPLLSVEGYGKASQPAETAPSTSQAGVSQLASHLTHPSWWQEGTQGQGALPKLKAEQPGPHGPSRSVHRGAQGRLPQSVASI